MATLSFPGFAIGGKAGAGKTTLASHIGVVLQELGCVPVRIAFADYLKNVCRAKYGLEKHDPGGREALIELGAEMRAQNPDVFVDALCVQYVYHRSHGRTPVIDDVRFPNELEWCKSRGLYLVRVSSSLRDRRERLARAGQDISVVGSGTLSETALDARLSDFDCLVENPSAYWRGCLRCNAVACVRAASGDSLAA